MVLVASIAALGSGYRGRPLRPGLSSSALAAFFRSTASLACSALVFAFTRSRRAHTYSVDRIARPAKISNQPGPGQHQQGDPRQDDREPGDRDADALAVAADEPAHGLDPDDRGVVVPPLGRARIGEEFLDHGTGIDFLGVVAPHVVTMRVLRHGGHPLTRPREREPRAAQSSPWSSSPTRAAVVIPTAVVVGRGGGRGRRGCRGRRGRVPGPAGLPGCGVGVRTAPSFGRGCGCVWVTPTMRTVGGGWLNVLPASANAPRDIARARAMPAKPYATIFVLRPMAGI